MPSSAAGTPALSGAVVGTVSESTYSGRSHSGDGGESAFQQAAAHPHQLVERNETTPPRYHHRASHSLSHHQHHPHHSHQQQQRRGLVAGPSRVNLAPAPSAVARAAEPSNFNVLEGAAESSGRVFITAYDDKGFTVGGRDLDSSILCVGDLALCWSPSCLADVTPDSLALFQLIRPQPELLLLGTGQRMQAVPGELREFVRACGMKLEVLSTRHAIATLNVLNEEGRSVAAALLLPSA
ncbi:unnamed protein product [Closterium sp. NIES-53]